MSKNYLKIGTEVMKNLPILKDLTNQFLTSIESMEDAAVTVAAQFGQGRENIVNIKAALNDATDSLRSVGVGIEEALGKAKEIQTEFSKTIGRNALLTSDSFGQIEAMTKVTKQSVSTITNSFADAGISILQAGGEMEKVIKSSREIGVNTEQVSSMVLTNLSKTAQFNFQGGVEGMAKMAAQAVNLRIDMNSTLQLADKLFDPDKAIDMAAAMQRLGVAQSDLLDPLRLMDLAQNDPAELQNQIAEMSKEFVRLNEKGQFEIMPGAKRQLKEIESQLGLNRGELSKMALAGAELEDKLTKIKLPEDTFTEEQRKFIANMATMDPGGEYKLKVDGKDLKLDEALNVFTKQEGVLEAFMEGQKEKSMEELAKEQIDIFTRIDRNIESLTKAGVRAGRAVGATKTTENVVTGVESITSELPKMFETGKLSATSLRGSTESGLLDLTKAIETGDIDEIMSTAFENTSGFFEKTIDGIIKKGKDALDNITKSENPIIKAAGGGFENATRYKILNTESETNKTTKEASVKPMMVNEDLKTPKPETKEASATEIKFTTPLTHEIKVSGVSGLAEEQVTTIMKKSFGEKTYDELVYEAWKRAESTIVGTTKP